MQFAAQVARLGGDCRLRQFKGRAVRDTRHGGSGINAVASDGSPHHKAISVVTGYFGVGVRDVHASQRASEALVASGVGPPVAVGVPVLVN